MIRAIFFLIAGIGSCMFGAVMFCMPAFGAQLLGLEPSPEIQSVLRGLGGLILGSGILNVLAKNITDVKSVRAILIANIITHLLGLSADFWGIHDGVLTYAKLMPVETTHIFIGFGSFIYLQKLKKVSA